ncbi:hypothetical protein [Longimonas halophila]|nr:hypothetical protein [Longimonas halophila]
MLSSVRTRLLLPLAMLTLLLSGCLPSGCSSGSFDAIAPSDSLSRERAATVAADSLRHVRTIASTETHPLRYPRSLRYRPSGTLVVADAERNSLHVIAPDGSYGRELTSDAFDVPYLAGITGDTLWVFNAGSDTVVGVENGDVLPDAGFAIERADAASLVYAAAHSDAFYLKVLGEDIGSTLYQYDWNGTLQAERPLSQPYWRYAGFLRIQGDTLWSLSGFRPVVDRLPLDLETASASPDTLALRGFDSPMLERSYAFLQGDTHEPPLLIPSATFANGRLFVLNVRSGWVQVDVFGRDGTLQHRLIEANPQPNTDFFPHDLSVRAHSDGYDITLAVSSPDPAIVTYRWTPSNTLE